MKASRIATWTLAGALSAATIGGVAYSASADTGATTPTSPPAATAKPHPKPHAKHPGGLLRGLEHGTFTVRAKKQTNKTFDLQRGTVSTVAPNGTTITVRSLDGFTQTYQVNSSTKVHRAGKPATIGDIHPNDRVQVVASAGTALRITDRPPATPGSAPSAG